MPGTPCTSATGSTSTHGEEMPPRTVSSGLNLWLELKEPSRMGELLAYLARESDNIQQALRALRYVHFSRFLPTPGWDLKPPPGVAALQVITEFDGDLDAYVLDFAMVIGEQFDTILGYVKDAPSRKVKDDPAGFLAFIRKNNVGNASHLPLPVKTRSAYPDRTVIDIIGSGGVLPRADEPPVVAVQVDRGDVQANVLQGLNMAHALHLGLRFSQPAGVRTFLAKLLKGEDGLPRVSDATRWAEGDRPACVLTVGLTFTGLQLLGLSPADAEAFKSGFTAFVRGPDDPEAAPLNGDDGASAPIHWRLGGPHKAVRLVLSVHADNAAELSRQTVALRGCLEAHGLTEVVAWSADALAGSNGPDPGLLHFGYRDGLSQPRLAIVSEGEPEGGPDMQPRAGVGEFLLGSRYPNVYGGASSLGGLSSALAENATFCALRILAQEVVAFERLLDEASRRHGVGREWLAAKLMGRWRDGTPLSQSPDVPIPVDRAPGRNAFDYAPSHAHPGTMDDADGLRCPVGAHVRRMNPRSATVAGKPYSRRLLRRGLPYGPAWQPGVDSPATERGLVGMFLCADLDRQFEFMLRQWGQGDQATRGVRTEQDPIIGAQTTLHEDHPIKPRFRIPRGGGLPDIVLDMPRLVTTVGSAYLFMPGLAGLKFLSQPVPPSPGKVTRATSALPPFDPTDDAFRVDPFGVYARYRVQAPVLRTTFVDLETVWVFSDAAVAAVAGNPKRYHKQSPGRPHETAGLLNMDDPPHHACRQAVEPLFKQAMAALRQNVARDVAQAVADAVAAQFRVCQALPQPVDWVAGFADPVARTLFFRLFGVDNHRADTLMIEVGRALARSSPVKELSIASVIGKVAQQVSGLSAAAAPGGLFQWLLNMKGPPFDPQNPSARVEQYANATTMVMTGVLPSKWAIALATWHLLDNGGVLLKVLRDNPDITDRVAAEELLRFDSPTPMSLRHATEDHDLGDVRIKCGDRVMVAWASASRDGTRFGPDADRIDFTRNRGPGWAFGHGGSDFECLGKELVLLTLSALIRCLRVADPVPTLAPGFKPLWDSGLMFRAIHQLPVSCQ